MLVDKNEPAPDDLTRINLQIETHVRYWCARFTVDAAQLRACVLEVGPLTSDVEARLKKAGKEAFKQTGED